MTPPRSLKDLRERESKLSEKLDFPTEGSTAYFDDLCELSNLQLAFKAVKRNKGAAGTDGQSVESFATNLNVELAKLQKELQEWRYEPRPVRRVEIPKPNGGVRLLGIPSVRDRVVQSAIKNILEPIFDPKFSDHSYGFRPGHNQKQAIEAAQMIVRSGKEFVVDIDLSKFFDRIHHDRLIARIKILMPDTRILRLIGKILRSGVMLDGLVSPTTEGSPQGGPLSPLLSNIVLDELDKELERRGLEFCRFADDCNIFVRTESSATRVMENVSKFIERRLKLVVNKEKSQVALSRFVKFLGMTIICGSLAISSQAMSRAMMKVKDLTPRGTHEMVSKTVERVNKWYVGWSAYFSMTQYPSQLKTIESHVRRRLRARIVSQQKNRRNLMRRMVERGVKRGTAYRTVYSNKGRWALSRTRAMHLAYPNEWFTRELGQKIRSDQNLDHWYTIQTWVKLREEPYT